MKGSNENLSNLENMEKDKFIDKKGLKRNKSFVSGNSSGHQENQNNGNGNADAGEGTQGKLFLIIGLEHMFL